MKHAVNHDFYKKKSILILCKNSRRLNFVSCENDSAQVHKFKFLNSNPGANINLFGLVKISNLDHLAINFNTENSISTISSKKENKSYDAANKHVTVWTLTLEFGRNSWAN